MNLLNGLTRHESLCIAPDYSPAARSLIPIPLGTQVFSFPHSEHFTLVSNPKVPNLPRYHYLPGLVVFLIQSL